MADRPAGRGAAFSQLERRCMWSYSDDGGREVKAFRHGSGAGAGAGTDAGAGTGAGSWVLVDETTGEIAGTVAAGEFSRRFRPTDVFADVTGFPTYLGTVTASADGTALVDLILDRDPFMLANGPGRVARPHVLMVPRRHRDGWSSATASELTARAAAMTLVAAWYRSLDGGHVVFCANDSPPNRDYLRDLEAAGGTRAGAGAGAGAGPVVARNPRQDVQHAHLHAFYAEDGETENHESSAARGHRVLAEGYRAFGGFLGGLRSGARGDSPAGDAVQVRGDGAALAADLRKAARPWGGGYCSYQPGPAGPGWVMPALGPSQDEFNRRLARADGLQAGPDPRLGGAVNLARPGLSDPGRLRAAEQATAEQRAGFRAFAAGRGLDPLALPEHLARGGDAS